MQLARVIGDVVATRKDPSLDGIALLLVQPLGADGEAVGRPLVAVDSVGAGVGEHVFFVRGKEASFPYHPVDVPADAGIVGIVDHWATGDRDEVVRPSRSGAQAEQSAGGKAGRSAGDRAGRSAGDRAGRSAGDRAGRSAGDREGRSAGDREGRSAGTSVPASGRRR